MASTIGRGLLAGAVGTALLNAVTYIDMALTDREASSAPAETTSRALEAVGVAAPAGANRREALGAVAGIATGLGIGVVASAARRAGLRLPAPVGAVAAGGLAMAATDGPMAALGVSDLRTWTATDWTRDLLPHLAYGVGVRWTLDRTERPGSIDLTGTAPPAGLEPVRPSAGRAVWKSLVIGLAAGGRSSLGFAAPLITSNRTPARLSGIGMVLGEMVVDKLPTTPSRLEAGPLGGRALAGVVGGAFVAGRNGRPALGAVGAVLGLTGAVTGSVLGAAWREIAQQQGYPWPAALVEDGVAVGLAAYALR